MNKETAFEKAHQAFRAAELARDKAETELNTAAAEYYQDRFGVQIGKTIVQCTFKNATRPSLIVGLRRVTGSIYQWQLRSIKQDGELAKQYRYLSAEAPIKVLGEYNGQKWKQP